MRTTGSCFSTSWRSFRRNVLQALRQPLETGRVTITRSGGSVAYPARFTLVAATNPCPCGWAGDTRRACRCTPAMVDAYQRRLSGPLLDRIDLKVGVRRVPLQALASEPKGEASAPVRERVLAARQPPARAPGLSQRPAQAGPAATAGEPRPGHRGKRSSAGLSSAGLTARGFHRAWRVARTSADLEGADAHRRAPHPRSPRVPAQ